MLPVFCLLLFGIIQFGIIFRDYVTLTDAVRAGARTAAVSRLEPSPAAVVEASVRTSATGSTSRARRRDSASRSAERGSADRT